MNCDKSFNFKHKTNPDNNDLGKNYIIFYSNFEFSGKCLLGVWPAQRALQIFKGSYKFKWRYLKFLN